MNKAIAAQRFQTTGLLGLALVVSLTGDGGHHDGSRPEALIRASPNCAQTLEPQDLVADEAGIACDKSDVDGTLHQPMRLARPPSGSRYPRLGDSTRYSF